ncbi:MAG TPA: hypothetical protein VNT79_00530 [Phycisphaerae bacterium]|nr:hypothetical protein [Phycisphaerae bacterium]
MTHDWQLIATFLGAAATLVGIPLTAIVFYLKVIREDQRDFRSTVATRVARIEAECDRIEHAVEQVERRYTTKEEWMRETMLARTQLGRLTELMARLQAELESSRALATQFVRATNAIIELTERLGRRCCEQNDQTEPRP